MGMRTHVAMATEMKTSNIDEMQQDRMPAGVGHASHFRNWIVCWVGGYLRCNELHVWAVTRQQRKQLFSLQEQGNIHGENIAFCIAWSIH